MKNESVDKQSIYLPSAPLDALLFVVAVLVVVVFVSVVDDDDVEFLLRSAQLSIILKCHVN